MGHLYNAASLVTSSNAFDAVCLNGASGQGGVVNECDGGDDAGREAYWEGLSPQY